MANLHDDCWRGTLTAGRLQRYLDVCDIDSVGGFKKVTPLAAACWRGHLNVVALLLDNPYKLADPNALSPHNRTPLFYATTCSPPVDRAAIVQVLLKASAEVNSCSIDDGFNTPLMNAIIEVQDPEVARILVDRGASLTATNARGETPQALARGTPMEAALGGKGRMSTRLAAIIDVVVSVIVLITVYMSDIQTEEVANGIVTKLCGTCATKEPLRKPEVVKDLSDPQTTQEVVVSLNGFVKDFGLEMFFSPANHSLQRIAEQAVALRHQPTTDLGSPENINRITRLSLYRLVLYCDDSGSLKMNGRYDIQRELAKRMAHVSTRLTPDHCGVELCFINARSASNLNAAQIEDVMRRVDPAGSSNLGTRLRTKILQPLVYDVLTHPSKHRLERPLLVTIMTDGAPEPESRSTFKDAIVECRRRVVNAGYEPTAVMFCISQIGDDQKATEFIDELRTDREIEDVLYCTSDPLDQEFREIKPNEKRLDAWLLKVLTAPIMD